MGFLRSASQPGPRSWPAVPVGPTECLALLGLWEQASGLDQPSAGSERPVPGTKFWYFGADLM